MIGFFFTTRVENETERQLHLLLTTYREDMGAGFHPTFWNLFTALSACYPLLCLLGGLTLGYLLIKHTEPAVMKGMLAIHLAIFTICFLVMAFLTFLPPIFLTGLVAVNLLLGYIFCPKIESIVDL